MIIARQNKTRQNGFTLIELMVTVAVIAIIAMIAYPTYNNYVTKARRADAKAALMAVMQAQQRHYTAKSTYVTNLTEIGYDTTAEVPSESKHYKVTATACGGGITSCVKLTAVPEHTDEDCGNLIYQSNGVKSVSVSGDEAVEKCW